MNERNQKLFNDMFKLGNKISSYIRRSMVRNGSLEIISHEIRIKDKNLETLEEGDDLSVLSKISFEPKKPN